MKNQICMVCRSNPATDIQSRMRKISEVLRNVEPNKTTIQSFNWNFSAKCKYGLKCPDAEKIIFKLERDLNDINAKLVTVALDSEPKLYYQILQLLRGYFPTVYNQLVRLHNNNE